MDPENVTLFWSALFYSSVAIMNAAGQKKSISAVFNDNDCIVMVRCKGFVNGNKLQDILTGLSEIFSQ